MAGLLDNPGGIERRQTSTLLGDPVRARLEEAERKQQEKTLEKNAKKFLEAQRQAAGATGGGPEAFSRDLGRNALGLLELVGGLGVGLLNEIPQGIAGLGIVSNPFTGASVATDDVAGRMATQPLQLKNPFPLTAAGRDTQQRFGSLLADIGESEPVQTLMQKERTLEEAANELAGGPAIPGAVYAGLLAGVEIAGPKGTRGMRDVESILGPVTGNKVATDLARVNFPEDVPRPPELTRKSVGKGGRVPGAPAHVKTAADEVRIIDGYLSEAELGSIGRDWYSKAAARMDRDTGNLAGARPGAADQAAAVIGEFSPRATLEANRLAQVRAINQHATGQPVAAGMGPRNKAAQQILDTGTFSAGEALKVGPFSMQVRGLPAARGVHDVRDLQGWECPRDLSPSTANHRWMDKMTDDAVRIANERKLGGFDDWTHEKLQAARWVKHKADELGVDVSELINEFGPADDFLVANIFSEAIPSKELTVHTIMDAELDKRAYTNAYQRTFTNPEGQSALAQQTGLLSPEQTRFVGEWEGATNPNIVTRIMADPAKGADVISTWSEEAINFNAALQGLLGGQADVATSFLRKPKRLGDANAFRIPFDRKVTEADLLAYKNAGVKTLRENDVPGEVIINYRGANELELTWLPPFTKEWDDLVKAAEGGDKAALKQLNKTKKNFRDAISGITDGRGIAARNSGGLITFADEFKPSSYLQHLQNPKMRASVEGMLPKIAADIERTMSVLPLSDRGRDIYLRTVTLIKTGGLPAVEDAVKQGLLPAAVIGALLYGANQVPEQPAALQGLLQPTI